MIPSDMAESLDWSAVVGAYLAGRISLARAAAILDLHPLELLSLFQASEIPLLLGPEDAADAQAEIDAIRTWKQSPPAGESR